MQNSQSGPGRAPNPESVARHDMRERAEPLGRPMMGWQTRFRYLQARLTSRYSSDQELVECRAELLRLRQAVGTLHASLGEEEVADDDTGILVDMDSAYRRLLADIGDVLDPAATAAE